MWHVDQEVASCCRRCWEAGPSASPGLARRNMSCFEWSFRLSLRIYIAKDSEQGDRDVALKLEVKAQAENQNVELSRSKSMRCCTPLRVVKGPRTFWKHELRCQ